MAHRRMTFDAWMRAAVKAYGEPRYLDLNGDSPGGAAVRLGVARQRVYQLAEEGRLDMLSVLGSDGETRFTVITENSLQAELVRRKAIA